jgi:sulfoxide reductase catalytic subunit YedY
MAQCLLASRMNGQRLRQVYGAPLRLRVENQLGYKMVKWIERIEFIEGSEIRLSRCMPAQTDSPTRAT